MTEQGVLRASIVVTFLVATFGIVFGLLSGSFSIAFDGVYSLADAGMTTVALGVSHLIVQSAKRDALSGKLRNRFTMGFWHLEPIVLGLNGTILIIVAIYALINALLSIQGGGRELEFGFAIAYAATTLLICLVMAAIDWRANRAIQSDFLKLDIHSWVMSGAISGALLVAFAIGYGVEDTMLEWISPYIDPVALAVISAAIIPIPIGTVRQAVADMLLLTPPDLKEQVDGVAKETVARHGFLGYRAYVAKVGRAKQIEIYFIVARDGPARRLEEWDRIRDEIGEAIGDESHNRWLTIAFTTDREWAE
ncbi:cation diffusion facilitator family transporter [Kaistia nematophila]|uniref:Cation transporter n=1 Tax=Kaistia nematophila TaxID=2994654 RepID=A0A9X3IJV5_9HYPH|nr:cation transporter [Kaistia nematophila]MCX5567831.1 cation transporter [Kaistia nematophila]